MDRGQQQRRGHKTSNGCCTQIGNAHFAWFDPAGPESRLSFLELPPVGFADYISNAKALAYMDERAWPLTLPGCQKSPSPEPSRPDRHNLYP